VIVIEGLAKRYGAVQAVQSVSFHADDGKVTGLLGPNGAGKTTTLRMLSSLVEPDAGRALVDGIDVRENPQAALRRLGILPDSRGLYPRLTAREHLAYFGGLHGIAPPEIEQRTAELTQLLDMQELARMAQPYYHRFARAGGFAFQRVYTEDRTLDETMTVEDRDVVLVPRGYHPVSAAHGFDLYYLNVMAGPVRRWQVTQAPGYEFLTPRR